MATLSTDVPVTPLRQRMQQDMLMRGLGSHTQQDYIRHVRRFAAFLGRAPDTATAEDIRRFQLHQHERGVGPATINGAVSALRFLFAVTLKRRDLARALVIIRYRRKLPDVLSVRSDVTGRHYALHSGEHDKWPIIERWCEAVKADATRALMGLEPVDEIRAAISAARARDGTEAAE